MIATLVLTIGSLRIISAGEFEGSSVNFPNEVTYLAKNDGWDVMAGFQNGMTDFERTVRDRIRSLSDYVTGPPNGQPDSVTSLRRSQKRPGLFSYTSITNIIKCDNLTSVVVGIVYAVGETALLFTRVVKTTTNYTMAFTNCSDNFYCMINLVIDSRQVFKEYIQEIKDFDLKIRRIINMMLTCAVGDESDTSQEDTGRPTGSNSTSADVPALQSDISLKNSDSNLQVSRRFLKLRPHIKAN